MPMTTDPEELERLKRWVREARPLAEKLSVLYPAVVERKSEFDLDLQNLVDFDAPFNEEEIPENRTDGVANVTVYECGVLNTLYSALKTAFEAPGVSDVLAIFAVRPFEDRQL